MNAAFGESRQEGPDAATLSGVRVGGRLHIADLTVGADERVPVTGPKGAGKTTLLHLMAGLLRPDPGTVSAPARVGLLHQEGMAVRSGGTVLQAYAAGLPGVPEDHREGLAALGLFRPGVWTAPWRTSPPGSAAVSRWPG